MKKITFLMFCLLSLSLNAQIFSDDFEDQDISDWTLLDEDGDGFDFMAYDPSVAQDGVSNYLSSESWDPTAGALTPNNYVISPAIDATGATSLLLNYDVGGQDVSYSAENYTVYVSTGNTVADFMNSAITVSFTENLGADANAAGAFVSRSLDASALDGATTIYVAFRHHAVSDQFIINFDNVIMGATLSVDDYVFNNFTHYMDVNNNLKLVSQTKNIESIEIYNLLGQKVSNQKINAVESISNLDSLQRGVYITKVTIASVSSTFKIIVK